MSEHFKSLSAVFPVILRENSGKMQVLLHRRAYTGYMDGKWDFAGSGHVDEGESAKMAVVRECFEELGITVEIKKVDFIHLSHRIGQNGNRTYYDIYFIVKEYEGTAIIAEPHKCAGLEWFYFDKLPNDFIDVREQAFQDYLHGITYRETFYQ